MAGTPTEGGDAQKKQEQFRLDPTDADNITELVTDAEVSRSKFLRWLVHEALTLGLGKKGVKALKQNTDAQQ